MRFRKRGEPTPVTPAEVHDVAFRKPPIGRRGYDEDDVDEFLDRVETELIRLIGENSDLKSRVTELEDVLRRNGLL